MKNNLCALILIVLTLFISFPTYAQQYQEKDKEGLRQFLRQEGDNPDGDKKVYNFEVIGLTTKDTLAWYKNEGWIKKSDFITGQTNLGFMWKKGKLIYINKKSDSKYKLAGILDCTPFEKLEYLSLSNESLSKIDVSANSSLTYLEISNMSIPDLDLTNISNLKELYCYGNQLTFLDLSDNRKLERIDCSNNQLTGLNLSHLNELSYLNCSDNLLKSLDLSTNINMKWLECSYNKLNYLDLSTNSKLFKLVCFNNYLTNLDISNNHDLGSDFDLDRLLMKQLRNGKTDTYIKLFKGILSTEKEKNFGTFNLKLSDNNSLKGILYFKEDSGIYEITGDIKNNRINFYVTPEDGFVIDSEFSGSINENNEIFGEWKKLYLKEISGKWDAKEIKE